MAPGPAPPHPDADARLKRAPGTDDAGVSLLEIDLSLRPADASGGTA